LFTVALLLVFKILEELEVLHEFEFFTLEYKNIDRGEKSLL